MAVAYCWLTLTKYVEYMNTNQNNTSFPTVGGVDFRAEVLRSSKPVLAVFGAPWSRPCRVVDAVLEEVAATCLDRIKIVKLNADDNPDLSLAYDVQFIPTLLLFAGGSLSAKIVGTTSKEAILKKIEECI
jgi:thioredoxin 1